MKVPKDHRYTNEHEWAHRDGDFATIGITDYAQEQLGPVVFVDLPEVGAAVVAHQSFGAVDSQKASSELFAPLTGTVVEVNTRLADEPELVNDDPYGEGWMIRIRMANAHEFDALLTPEQYGQLIAADGH